MPQPGHTAAKIFIVLFLCIILTAPGVWFFRPSENGTAALRAQFSNDEAVVASLRDGLKKHSQEITISFSLKEHVFDDLRDLADAWMEDALEVTSDPTEGDYLRYQMGGYSLNTAYEQDKARNTYRYTLRIRPSYYLYYEQEQQTDAMFAEVLASLDLENMTDEEIILRIYDYVCRNIRYDTVHSTNPYHTLRSTAYSALHYHRATCQGYCVTLYRLLKSVGIETRIVTGMAGDEFHAWNTVNLAGTWYILDATWDAGQEEYQYFLIPADSSDRGSGTLSDLTV